MRTSQFCVLAWLACAGLAVSFAAELVGHTEPVYDLVTTPDGQWLVTGSFDQTVRLWDASSLQPAVTMQGHTGLVLCVAVSPDSKQIASGGLDNTIRVWEVPKGTSLFNLTGHGSHIYGLAFSSDGKLLASASNDKTVRLWDVEKKTALRTVSTQKEPVYGVVFAPDNKSLVIAGGDKSVKLLSVDNGVELRVFKGPEFPVYTVALSPDGRTIAAGGVGLGPNRPIFIWNIDSPDPVKKLDGHKDDVYRVHFNAAGNKLLSIGYTGAIHVWDIAAGKPVFSHKLPTITYGGNYVAAGTRIAATAADGKTYFVDLPTEAR
jgi:WD40 repeat protein